MGRRELCRDRSRKNKQQKKATWTERQIQNHIFNSFSPPLPPPPPPNLSYLSPHPFLYLHLSLSLCAPLYLTAPEGQCSLIQEWRIYVKDIPLSLHLPPPLPHFLSPLTPLTSPLPSSSSLCPTLPNSPRGTVLTDPGLKNSCEDLPLAWVFHLREGDEIKMAQQSLGDRVSTTTRGAHGTCKVHIHQVAEVTYMAIIQCTYVVNGTNQATLWTSALSCTMY